MEKSALFESQLCPKCGGAGKTYHRYSEEIRVEDSCLSCNGTGLYAEYCAVLLAGESAILPSSRLRRNFGHYPL